MTLEKMVKKFDKYYIDEFLQFSRIDIGTLASSRPDVNAFNLLSNLEPGHCNIVGSVVEGVMFLDMDLSVLAENISKGNIKDLLRCGVSYNRNNDCPANLQIKGVLTLFESILKRFGYVKVRSNEPRNIVKAFAALMEQELSSAEKDGLDLLCPETTRFNAFERLRGLENGLEDMVYVDGYEGQDEEVRWQTAALAVAALYVAQRYGGVCSELVSV